MRVAVLVVAAAICLVPQRSEAQRYSSMLVAAGVTAVQPGERTLLGWYFDAAKSLGPSTAIYDYADGNGGIAIVEAGSSEALLETVAPWAAFFEFTMRPLVPSEKATSIYEKGIAWRDSIR